MSMRDSAPRSSLPGLGTILSVVALAVSGFSLWESTLKQAKVSIFVPPVAQYSAPYSNSNFEVIGVPVTLVNDGARTATILALDLTVTDPRSGNKKRFYAADFGRWSMERTRTGAYQPFAPISLAGKTSRTESVLFYTRSDNEKPNEIIREVGTYQLEITVDVAESVIGNAAIRAIAPPPLKFERELRYYDSRAFTSGTLSLFDPAFKNSPSEASTAGRTGSSP